MKKGDSLNLNLLPSQAKFEATRMKLQGVLKRYMSLAVLLWIVVVIIVVVLYFGSDFILKLQKKKYDQSLNNFKGLSQEIVTNQLLKYRSKVLGEVLKNRFEYSSAFEKINSIFAQKAKVSNFKLNDNKMFLVEVTAADKEAVNFVEDKVTDINNGKEEGVEKAEIKSADYQLGSNWTIEMEVYIK